MRRGRKGKKKMNELTKSKVRLECEWIEMIPRHGPFTRGCVVDRRPRRRRRRLPLAVSRYS
jgi:hypothetical protein